MVCMCVCVCLKRHKHNTHRLCLLSLGNVRLTSGELLSHQELLPSGVVLLLLLLLFFLHPVLLCFLLSPPYFSFFCLFLFCKWLPQGSCLAKKFSSIKKRYCNIYIYIIKCFRSTGCHFAAKDMSWACKSLSTVCVE